MSNITENVREQLKKAFTCCLNPKIIYEDDECVKIRIEDDCINFKQLIMLMSISECNLLFTGISPIVENEDRYCLITYQKKGFFRHHFIRRIYDKRKS